MEKNIVKTVSGKSALKENCRTINRHYYLIGNINEENSGDVYLINDRYIRFSTGKIVFNHTKKEYQLKNDTLIEGIIKFNTDRPVMADKPIMGFFEFDVLTTVQVYFDKTTWLYCLNENVIPYHFRENRSTGVFYRINMKPVRKLTKLRVVTREYKESLNYDSKDIIKNFTKKYEANYNPTIGYNQKMFGKILDGLTFGLEFETTKGQLTNKKLDVLPLIPLRDGSIEGLEYVTLPLEGERGLQAVTHCVKELNKRTEFDNSCSLHTHIGNVPRTPEFILALYKFVTYFEGDLFEQFPLYKKYNFEVKRKNYSQPFPINKINFRLEPSINPTNKEQLDRNFDILFTYLSEGTRFENYGNDLANVNGHPNDPKGQAKWNIHTRYHFINFIPLIFGNKQTIEFRIHTPTYDIGKIMHFLLFNCIIINFVKENSTKILQIPNFLDRFDNLNNFVQEALYNDFLKLKGKLDANEITAIVDFHTQHLYRRKRAIYDFSRKGDIVGKEEEVWIEKLIDWDAEKAPEKHFYKGLGIRHGEIPAYKEIAMPRGLKFGSIAAGNIGEETEAMTAYYDALYGGLGSAGKSTAKKAKKPRPVAKRTTPSADDWGDGAVVTNVVEPALAEAPDAEPQLVENNSAVVDLMQKVLDEDNSSYDLDEYMGAEEFDLEEAREYYENLENDENPAP